MTKKRHKELTDAVHTIMRNLKEVPETEGASGGYLITTTKCTGFMVGKEFYHTLEFMADELFSAERNGFVK